MELENVLDTTINREKKSFADGKEKKQYCWNLSIPKPSVKSWNIFTAASATEATAACLLQPQSEAVNCGCKPTSWTDEFE